MAAVKKNPGLTPPPPPPPVSTKHKGVQAAYDAYIAAHPVLRDYSDGIKKWATRYGLDPTYYAALIYSESKGDPSAVSPTGAGVGLGQINPIHVGESVPWRPNQPITRADLTNPDFNLHWSAYYFAQGKEKYGTYDATYNNWYNPGYTGPSAFKTVPKAYAPHDTGYTPDQTAGNTAESAGAKVATFDRWAVLGSDGRVKFVKIKDASAPPKNVLHYGPTPLTQTQFLATWKQNYQDTFFSYTGRQASGKEIAGILSRAPSLYTLAQTLAKTKSFVTSPTFKAHAPGIVAIAKQAYGQDWKVDRAFIAKAISQNWDQATLEQNLRSRPEYFQGPQFMDDKAKMGTVYQQIYGADTDSATQQVIDHVARNGWTQDQFASWLRTQPEYKNSQEFKTKAISFAQQLGLLTGKQVTLTADQAMLGGPPAASTATPAPPKPDTSDALSRYVKNTGGKI